MIIKFKNWDKYNTRQGGIKRPWWFCFGHDFFMDTKMFALSVEEKLTLIYLLCEASKNSPRGSVFLIPEHYEKFCLNTAVREPCASRSPSRALNRCIQKLYELHIIEQPRERGAYARLEEIRLEEKRRDNNIAQNEFERISFDFEFLYKKYPRKVGKSRGIKICSKDIKTAQEYQLLSEAIEKYSKHCAASGTEPQYIKHFSTFMAEWRDWTLTDAGAVEKPKLPEPEWMRLAREEENAV